MTYLGVVVLDVDKGLYIGIAFSLLLVIFRSQRLVLTVILYLIKVIAIEVFGNPRARATVLGNIPGTSVYEDMKICEAAREFEHVKIVRYEESIYYANVDNFKYKIVKLSGVDPVELLKIQEKHKRAAKKHSKRVRKIYFCLTFFQKC